MGPSVAARLPLLQLPGHRLRRGSSSRTGSVFSFTVVRHPLRPTLAAIVPFVSGVVELDGTQGAGARMLANVINCDPDTLKIGDRVRVVFEQVSDAYAVPRFTPV